MVSRLTSVFAPVVLVLVLVSTVRAAPRVHKDDQPALLKKGHALVKWLEKNGGNMLTVKLDVDDKGLILKFDGNLAPVSSYTYLLHERTTLTLSQLHTDTTVGKLRLKNLNARELMALWLMREKRNPNSFWRPWIEALPETPLATEFFQQSVRDNMQGYLKMRAEQLEAGLKRRYEWMFPRLWEEHPKIFHKSFCTWENFLWAYVTVRQNSVVLNYKHPDENFERNEATILPTLLAMRHADKVMPRFARDYASMPEHIHVHYQWGCKGQPKDTADPSYKVCRDGEPLQFQMQANYSNVHSLLRHGFVQENNPYDMVVISLSGVTLSDNQKELIDQHNIDPNYEFAIVRNQLPEDLIVFTQIMAPGHTDGTVLLDLWDRDLAIAALRDQLHYHLTQNYPTTIEYDTDLIAQINPVWEQLDRDQLARADQMYTVIVERLGEKQTLLSVVELLNDALPKKLRRADIDKPSPPPKEDL